MGWASRYIQKLRAGATVSFRPHGQSMAGRIESGQLCTVVPIDPTALKVGDIVLCKVSGNEYLHIGIYGSGVHRGRSRTVIGPSCCCGLEGWKAWLDILTTGQSPWMGHDPAPFVELLGEQVCVCTRST
jgi:hypothetical protein